jgi:hypothetical protein
MREVEWCGLGVMFIMMIVVSNRNRAICFGKLREWRVCSNGYWMLKDVSDREGRARVWRRESRIFNSSFSMEGLHI